MFLMSNLRFFFIYLINFQVPILIFSEPFLSPHDPFIRHELRLLQDHGTLSSTINSWPINLGGLRKNEVKNSWTHDLLEKFFAKNRNPVYPSLNLKLVLLTMVSLRDHFLINHVADLIQGLKLHG